MKTRYSVQLTLYFCILIFAFYMQNTFAQQGWVVQSSGTGNNLRGVNCINRDTAVVVGDGGIILRTTNGGSAWSLQNSGTTNNLSAVTFPDPVTGYAAGYGGTILKTTDGGVTWISEQTGISGYLLSVSFIDESTGIAGGQEGAILKTTDGGSTWIANTLRSTDGGQTWKYQPTGATMEIKGISMQNSNTIYIVGKGLAPYYGSILKSTDGGSTWSLIKAYNINLEGISFSNPNNVIVVGAGSRPYYHYFFTTSSNGGDTWFPLEIGREGGDFLYASDSKTSTMVGQRGAIFRGVTFQSCPTSAAFYGVSFYDYNTGLIVGANGTILKTGNGGIGKPLPPALNSPANNSSGISTSPTLVWSYRGNGADKYESQVSTDTGFSSIAADTIITVYTYAPSISWQLHGLSENTHYYWRVRAIDSYNNSDWSESFAFTTVSSNPDLIVYETTLKSPWQDASWSSTIVYTDTNAIQVSADAWGALSLHYGIWGTQGIDPGKYSDLGISLYGNASVAFFFENDSGQSFPYVLKNAGGNSWVDFTVPMSTLNPNNYTITRIDFQSDNGSPVLYYIRNVRLIGSIQSSAKIASGSETKSNITSMPKTYGLSQNYPNPFNPTTEITYAIPAQSLVILKVYDILGREVATLVNSVKAPGTYRTTFNGNELASGVYIYRIQADKFIAVKKLMLMK